MTLSTVRISIADMMALHVRTRGPRNAALPQFLYQGLPASAMALMATIPRGAFAVSIPHKRGPGGGYRILQSPPPDSGGFVIVYVRQPNARYEARDVRFRGGTFAIAEFYEIACQWVREHEGSLRTLPGRYAYWAPSREQWGVILRDSGYISVDPSLVPSDLARVSNGLGRDPEASGICIRIPVQAGDRQPPQAAVPAFARVDLTLDPGPSPQSLWVPFAEYQRARALQSRPPADIIPDLCEWLAHLATESGFKGWRFRPGMLFGDRIEWWGDRSRRRTEHEGVDFAEGLGPGEEIRSIPEGTPVRSIADGEVVAFLDDFLGKTVVVRHPKIGRDPGKVFHTIFSHIRPASGLSGPVVKGRLLGTVGKSTAAGAPAHFHLSGAWIPQSIPPNEIRLDHINPAFEPIVLVDFNNLVQKDVRADMDMH